MKHSIQKDFAEMQYVKDVAPVMRILRKQQFAQPAVTEVAKTEDPFKVLVSCIISLRTRDAVTEKASGRLFALAATPGSMMRLRTARIAEAIYPASFYRTKAKRIKDISKLLVTRHNGTVPADFDTLMTFKGVGRKTANIVMVYGFGKPAIPVDVHVHVVANRLGWVNTKDPDKTELELRKIVPKRYWMNLNDLFVMHGQNICQTRKPKCGECPISRHCRYFRDVHRKEANK